MTSKTDKIYEIAETLGYDGPKGSRITEALDDLNSVVSGGGGGGNAVVLTVTYSDPTSPGVVTGATYDEAAAAANSDPNSVVLVFNGMILALVGAPSQYDPYLMFQGPFSQTSPNQGGFYEVQCMNVIVASDGSGGLAASAPQFVSIPMNTNKETQKLNLVLNESVTVPAGGSVNISTTSRTYNAHNEDTSLYVAWGGPVVAMCALRQDGTSYTINNDARGVLSFDAPYVVYGNGGSANKCELYTTITNHSSSSITVEGLQIMINRDL